MNDEFVNNLVKMRGEAGKQWIATIPANIKKYEERWGMKVLSPFHLTNNYVAPAIKNDGTPVVLKMRFPKDREFPSECKSLQVFNGIGSVKLLNLDEENAVMLLEKIVPGTFLRTIKNDEALITILSGVIKALERPATSVTGFQTLTDLGKGFANVRNAHSSTTGPFPKDLFEKAEGIFREYAEHTPETYFLHGDLHKDNILLAERGWVTIDPMGIIGEHEFETAMFLKNPYYDLRDDSTRKGIIERRVAQLASELGFDKQKMYNWAFAQAMLSALWILEDYNEVSDLYLQNAALLEEFV